MNGQTGSLTAIAVKDMADGEKVDLLDGNDINVKYIVEENCEGFTYGDMTSVAVSADGTKLAAAVQAEGYADNGRVAVFTCNADGTLTFEQAYETGVQPDMVTFTPDDGRILTANEGEPREGYTDAAADPAGTVTVITPADGTAVNVDFTAYDTDENRQQLACGCRNRPQEGRRTVR